MQTKKLNDIRGFNVYGTSKSVKKIPLIDPFIADFSQTLSSTHAKASVSRVQLKDWQAHFCNRCQRMKGMINARNIFA